MNILDSLKSLVTDELVTQAADLLGEESSAISKGMQGAIPALLGGLMDKGSKNQDALTRLFKHAAENRDLLGDLLDKGGTSDGGRVDSLISNFLGDKVNGILNVLTNLGGFKNEGSSKSILGIVGSLIASFFGKKMLKDGLDFGGILNMIRGEKEDIMAAAPAGVMDTLAISAGPWETVKDSVADGTSKVAEVTGDVIKDATTMTTDATEKVVDSAGDLTSSTVDGAKKGMKWLLPVLLLAILAIGVIWFVNGCNNGGIEQGVEADGVSVATSEGVEGVSDTAVDASDETSGIVDATNGALDDAGNWIATKGADISIKLDDGTELASTKGSVVDKLHQFVSSPDAVADKSKAENWFNFEDVLFETGSSKLKSGSEAQLKNVVAVLKVFPNVKVKLGGYTDNTGAEDVNIKISNDRAKVVYNKLISLGADATSFDEDNPYEGYGPQHPVCPANDTEECKAQNRRIAIVVTEK